MKKLIKKKFFALYNAVATLKPAHETIGWRRARMPTEKYNTHSILAWTYRALLHIYIYIYLSDFFRLTRWLCMVWAHIDVIDVRVDTRFKLAIYVPSVIIVVVVFQPIISISIKSDSIYDCQSFRCLWWARNLKVVSSSRFQYKIPEWQRRGSKRLLT